MNSAADLQELMKLLDKRAETTRSYSGYRLAKTYSAHDVWTMAADATRDTIGNFARYAALRSAEAQPQSDALLRLLALFEKRAAETAPYAHYRLAKTYSAYDAWVLAGDEVRQLLGERRLLGN